jgi:hypothetical protein
MEILLSLKVLHNGIDKFIVKVLLEKYGMTSSTIEKSTLKQLIDKMILKFPSSVGNAVDDFINDHKVSEENAKETLLCVSNAMKVHIGFRNIQNRLTFLKGTIYEPLPETGFSLIASLQHKDEAIQLCGIKALDTFFDVQQPTSVGSTNISIFRRLISFSRFLMLSENLFPSL